LIRFFFKNLPSQIEIDFHFNPLEFSIHFM